MAFGGLGGTFWKAVFPGSPVQKPWISKDIMGGLVIYISRDGEWQLWGCVLSKCRVQVKHSWPDLGRSPAPGDNPELWVGLLSFLHCTWKVPRTSFSQALSCSIWKLAYTGVSVILFFRSHAEIWSDRAKGVWESEGEGILGCRNLV